MQNKKNSTSTQISKSICNSSNDKNSLTDLIMNYHTLEKSSNITGIDLFDKSNCDNLNNNNPLYKAYEKIIENNLIITEKEQQKTNWSKLISIIDSMDKTYIAYPFPILPFGESLEVPEFLKLFQETINYICYLKPIEEIEDIKEDLKDVITKNIFSYPKILKDLKENGLLTYILAETEEEKEESLDILKIKECSFTPLIELRFKKQGINYDLNKKELKSILTSKILLYFFQNNLVKFIPEFSKKIKNDNELIPYINHHLDNYNFYFCDLPSNIHAVTIHTGNIYIQSKYITEYFENINKTESKRKEEESIVIREKIVLNIIHEMNHILLRLIDENKNKNFFLKSLNSDSKREILLFKDKFNVKSKYPFSGNESGNNFDYNFYKGYYFNYLFKNEANFFLDIKNIKDEKEFNSNFDKMILETKKNRPKKNSICKFNKKYEFSKCFKSKIFGMIIEE